MEIKPNSEIFFQTLNKISEPVVLLSVDLKFMWANESYLKHMNLSYEEALTKKIDDIMPGEYIDILKKKFRTISRDNVSFENLYPLKLPDGSYMIETWHNEGIFDQSGKLLYYYCIATIKNRNSDEILAENEISLVSNMLLGASVIGIIIAVEDRIIYINRKISDIFGTAADRLIKAPKLREYLEKLLQGNAGPVLGPVTDRPEAHEVCIKHPDGYDCWVSIIRKEQFFNSVKTDLFIFEEITERKLNEIESLEANNKLNNMARIAKLGYWEKDFNNIYWRWSDETYDIYEIARGTLITEEVINTHITPESALQRRKNMALLLKTDNPTNNYSFEYKIITDAGKIKWIAGEAFYHRKTDETNDKFYGWVQDITSRKQIEEDLIKAKEKAEESERLKTSFIENMSHEIRTPLNAILGFSDLLTKNPTESEKHKFKKIINQSSKLLLKVIDDILDISTIESGNLDLEFEEIPVQSLFQSISDVFTEHENTEIFFFVEEPEEDIIIRTDRERLKQVLLNLINNAFKYTLEGCITVSCKPVESGEYITFSVKDTGIGIEKEQLEHIFDRFYQADTFSKGTGLGLAISKSIVEQMQGSISVTSTPGAGSVFSFTIPRI